MFGPTRKNEVDRAGRPCMVKSTVTDGRDPSATVFFFFSSTTVDNRPTTRWWCARLFFPTSFFQRPRLHGKSPIKPKKKQQVFLFKQNGRTETEKRKRDSDLSTPNMTGTLMGCTEFFCCCCFFFWSFSCSVRGRFLIRPSSANRNWPSFSVVATFFSFLSFFFL